MKYLLSFYLSFLVLYPGIMAQSTNNNRHSLSISLEKLVNNHKKDSLLSRLPAMPDDTVKVLRLIEISSLQSMDSAGAVTCYAENALVLSRRIHFRKGIARACNAIGLVFQNKKKYDSAVAYYQQALEAGESYSSNTGEDEFFTPLLNMYFYLGDYSEAMKLCARGLARAERGQDEKSRARFTNLLGYINTRQGKTTEAAGYYRQYLELAIALRDGIMMAHAYSEASEVFIQEKRYRFALAYLEKAASIYFNIDEQYRNSRSAGPDSFSFAAAGFVKVMYQTGRTYRLMNRLDSALQYSMAAIAATDSVAVNNYDLAVFYINAGDVYRLMREYPLAVKLLHRGLALSTAIQHREDQRDACQYLSLCYEQEKKYDSAFLYYRHFTSLNDSVMNMETRMKIAEIEGQYNVAKKDREISKEQQFRNILLTGFAFVLLAVIFLYNRHRLRQQHRYEQAIRQKQNELFNVITHTQDQERKRIAEDLHDGLGSLLSAARLRLSDLAENRDMPPDAANEKFTATMTLLDEAVGELRNISHDIMPATLSKLGIVAALKNLIDKITPGSGLQVDFSVHGFDQRIAENVEMSIYRIILELINNIVKHAGADKVTIQLIRYPGYINFTVEDNGRGFKYDDPALQQKGIGLGNIASRVNYLDGTVVVDSEEGRGTTVIVEIPYKG